jgi:hypothetical protein
MTWEETERELTRASGHKQVLENYIMQHPNQSGMEYCELLDVKDQIAALAFRRDCELQQDHYTIQRFQ